MPRRANPDRTAARLTGRSHYTGGACRRGHPGLRYASTGACVECVAGYRAAVHPFADLLGSDVVTGV